MVGRDVDQILRSGRNGSSAARPVRYDRRIVPKEHQADHLLDLAGLLAHAHVLQDGANGVEVAISVVGDTIQTQAR